MKNKYITLVKYALCAIGLTTLTTACNDYLDITPPSDVTEASYLKTDAQLGAYVIQYYADYGSYSRDSDDKGGMLPTTWGSGGESPLRDDINTDNEVGRDGFSNLFLAGKPAAKQMGQTGGKWNFSNIYKWNYFINLVNARMENGEISGNMDNAKHYLGEAYFLRALEYYFRLRKLGDFPIVTTVLPDQHDALVEASKRQPRNEVARFILSDLDKAIELMMETAPEGNKTRLSRDAAYLLKARVALFEGTWLKYHAGTALVPNGQGWPGKDKEYNANYLYPTGSVDKESEWFLDQAMTAAKQIAENRTLVSNNGQVILDAAGTGYSKNEYYDMFSCSDPSAYDEVIMTRLYKKGSVQHWYNQYIQAGGGGYGYTKSAEKAFLMKNGMPYYAADAEYAGDNTIAATKENRDNRWQLFMKATGERAYMNSDITFGTVNEAGKLVTNIYDNDGKKSTSTGYIRGKGFTLDVTQAITSFGEDVTASVIFRAAEAYLIYIEADYVKDNSLDSYSDKYWKALRARAGVDTDYTKTIAATDMAKEAQTDWAAYSHGQLVDATLFNIRRERRCEFIGEGFRLDDLYRWRALDQLNGARVYGCKIADRTDYNYGGTKNYLDDKKMKLDGEGYIDILTSADYINGLFFCQAHYLDPINVQHFLITAEDGATVSTSPIYQNPGWPIQNGGTASVY